MREVVVLGVGMTKFGISELSMKEMFALAALEALGFFEFGEGAAAVDRGDTSLKGMIPINPSGGLKSKGHPIGATGAAQTYEIVKQLRGECHDRQVEGAKIGVVDTLGGDFSIVCNLVLRRH